jgi:hypothetical protein
VCHGHKPGKKIKKTPSTTLPGPKKLIAPAGRERAAMVEPHRAVNRQLGRCAGATNEPPCNEILKVVGNFLMTLQSLWAENSWTHPQFEFWSQKITNRFGD